MTARIRKFAYLSLTLVLLAYAVANWFTTIRELRRFYINMWIWDPWDYLAHFAAYRHFDLSVFWIQHNEHREIGTELLYVIDTFLFHGRQILPEIVAIAAYLGVLLIMVACAWFSSKDKWATSCAALLAAAIAGFKICAISLTIPFLTSWPQWEFFGIAALAALVLHEKRGGKLFLIAAVISGIAATYSMSNGMLIWPLLIAAALLLRLSLRHTAAILICAAVSIALYFFHYHNLHSLSLQAAFRNPEYFAIFVGSFLGLPFSAAFHVSSPLIYTSRCGWIALAIAAFDLTLIVRKKVLAAPVVIVLGGFGLLVLASSVLTALGRMDPPDPSLVTSRAGRYVTEPTLFWCALILLSVWLLGGAWKGYAAFVFLLIAGILSARILHRTGDYYKWWDDYFQRGQWAAIGLGNGVTDDAVGDIIYPSREYLAEFKHLLIDNRLAIFAGPEPGWIGRQASQTFSRGPDGYIHGDVTSVKKLGSDFEVQGWADGAARVVFVDEQGRIVGFGMRPRAGPVELYTNDVPRALAFTGFIRGEFGEHEFSLWAVDRKGRQISRMGRLWNALPQ